MLCRVGRGVENMIQCSEGVEEEEEVNGSEEAFYQLISVGRLQPVCVSTNTVGGKLLNYEVRSDIFIYFVSDHVAACL